MLENELLELVRAGFTKEDIMKLTTNEPGEQQPVPQLEQPVPQLEQPVPQLEQPVPQLEQQPVQQDEQPKLDFNHFLTVMRGEFDGLKKAMQAQNINTAVQPHTKSIDDLADDALASIITPKKKG